MPDPITSSEALDVELERLARDGGTPADFEAAVTALAARLEKPLGYRAALRIARVGWTSYNGRADVPADEPPEFQGRPWADLPAVRRRDATDGPRKEQLPDESLTGYVGYLGEDLFAHLGLGEEDVATPLGRAAVGYLSVLAIPGLRQLVGWERSVDAHALGMLTAERVFRHLGGVGMTADEEEACFRWLHLATYAEVTPEHVAEVGARRAVRLAHERQPAGAVAVMICEVAVEEALWFQERISAGPTAALNGAQLRAVIDELAVNAQEAERWAIRKDAFAEIGHLDLSEAATAQGSDYDAFIHGHLLRWMVEEDVPVRPHLLRWTSDYAHSIYLYLVDRPSRKGQVTSPLVAHLRAIALLHQAEGSVPLTDELVLLAWLMDQRGFAVRLAGYLIGRDKQLAGRGP